MISIHILLVEDNEGDVRLTTEAPRESKTINTKPIYVNDFLKAVPGVGNFWLNTVSLPNQKQHYG